MTYSICLACADTEQFFTAAEISASTAVIIRLSFAVIMLACVLHHGDERITFIRVLRLFDEIGINGDRVCQRIYPITFLIISVMKCKTLPVDIHDPIKLSFTRSMCLFMRRVG